MSLNLTCRDIFYESPLSFKLLFILSYFIHVSILILLLKSLQVDIMGDTDTVSCASMMNFAFKFSIFFNSLKVVMDEDLVCFLTRINSEMCNFNS